MAQATVFGYVSGSAPSTPASGVFLDWVDSADNRKKIVGSDGIVHPLNNLMTSNITSSSGAINNSPTYLTTAPLHISANDLTVGTIIRFTFKGTSTCTAGNAQTFTLRYGSAGSISDTSFGTVAITSATSGSAIPFKIVIDAVVSAIGTSGTVYGYVDVFNQGTTGFYTLNYGLFSITTTALTINTTAAGYLGVSFVTAATTTTDTFSQTIIELIRQ